MLSVSIVLYLWRDETVDSSLVQQARSEATAVSEPFVVHS